MISQQSYYTSYYNGSSFGALKYSYCGNNPIMLIDPDGNDPKPPRSRIEYRGNGVFGINVNNLNKATRNNFYAANGNPSNWAPGEIGLNTTVAAIQIKKTSTAPSTAGVDPQHTTTRTVSERIASSTGQPDKRDSRTISTVGGGGASRGFGFFALAVNAVNLTYDMWNIFSTNGDMNAIAKQKGLLQQAFGGVSNAVNNGMIPSQYQNADDLGAITNFVFQGENSTGNKDITKIGTSILKLMGRYDENTKQVKPLIEE